MYSVLGTFEILSRRGSTWVASQETKEKNPDKKEDDRVYGNLEGKHEYRPRLSKPFHLMWLRGEITIKKCLKTLGLGWIEMFLSSPPLTFHQTAAKEVNY